MRNLILLFFILGGGGFIVWHMLKFLFSISNSWSKINRELEDYEVRLSSESGQLVPWKSEEIELLSIRPEIISSKKALNETVEGYIKNLYEERVIHFVYRQYYATSRRAFMVLQTSEDTFVYRFKGGQTDLLLNNQPFAQVDDQGRIVSGDNQLILSLETIKIDKEHKEIYANDERIALLANPFSEHLANDRAIQVMESQRKADFPDELVLGLLGHELLEANII